MDPGAYPEPLLRTTLVHATMVSGYVGSRLRISDYAFGTNFTNTNLPDKEVHMLVQNVSVSTTGTTVYFQVNQTLDDGPSGVRSSITSQYGVVPGGMKVVDFYVNAPFIEIACVSGGGNIRAQLTSRLKWEEMAFDKTDPYGAPQLWNQLLSTVGVVAPQPFPTS
jgi:hypothetical protein